MLLYVDPAYQLAVHVSNRIVNSSTSCAEFILQFSVAACLQLAATVGMVAWFLEVRWALW